MALTTGQSSGTMDLTEIEYFEWSPEVSLVSIHMHLDAVDGILRDLNEGFESHEVGGLLLGRVVAGGDKPGVWVERYERISCSPKISSEFVLDERDKAGLEKAAADILANGELAVVGLYRSHLRAGFQLEDPDFELVRRYFSDPSDLVLLIKPEGPSDVSARFYVHDTDGGARAAGDPFPFRGRVLNPPAKAEPPPEPANRERARRLVPDFEPLLAVPATTQEEEAKTPPPPLLFAPRERIFEEEEDEAPGFGKRLKRWLPFLGALLLAGGALWWVTQTSNHQTAPKTPVVAPNEPARPLGLAVEPMGSGFQVSWNPNATALHDARSVQLFVRDGDDQNRIDLSPRELAAGVYLYQSAGSDITFRLEVVENSGGISAESFRFVRATAPSVAPPAPKAASPRTTPPREARPVRRTEPKAIHRAPPVIAASIRPRITNPIAIDVRVHIDERGRVTSAAPVVKPHQGIDSYLAGTAVKAARLWRFEPARENGKPVAGTETLHFVFQK